MPGALKQAKGSATRRVARGVREQNAGWNEVAAFWLVVKEGHSKDEKLTFHEAFPMKPISAIEGLDYETHWAPLNERKPCLACRRSLGSQSSG